jgi:hypothetical protein
MQTVLLCCLFGAVFTMIMWVISSAAVQRDEMLRRYGRLVPPGEF